MNHLFVVGWLMLVTMDVLVIWLLIRRRERRG